MRNYSKSSSDHHEPGDSVYVYAATAASYRPQSIVGELLSDSRTHWRVICHIWQIKGNDSSHLTWNVKLLKD